MLKQDFSSYAASSLVINSHTKWNLRETDDLWPCPNMHNPPPHSAAEFGRICRIGLPNCSLPQAFMMCVRQRYSVLIFCSAADCTTW